MRINCVIPKTAAEGPGLRFCIWVQGCSRHCPGCFNPGLWNSDGGYEVMVTDLIQEILNTQGIEGITLLGGEPFEQASEAAQLCIEAQKNGLSVVVFTGFTLEELRDSDDPGVLQMMAEIDLLIDGPFIQEQLDYSRPWVGSKNQRYLFLTSRYSPASIEKSRQRVEIRISESGEIVINGMPDLNLQNALRNCLEMDCII